MGLCAHVTDGFVDTVAFYDEAPDDTWIGAPDGTIVGDSYAGSAFAHVRPATVTALAFVSRFTGAELAAMAALPAALVLLLTAAAAGQVDLADTAVAAAVNALTGPVLAGGRASAILTP